MNRHEAVVGQNREYPPEQMFSALPPKADKAARFISSRLKGRGRPRGQTFPFNLSP
jgi:hypothetical protein